MFKTSTTLSILTAATLLIHQPAKADDCLSWTSPTSMPSGFSQFGQISVVYDALRNVTIAIDFFGHTYEYVNNAWTLRATYGFVGSTSSDAAAATYRSATGQTLVYALGNTLESWNGQVWTSLGTVPFDARTDAAMAYDAARDRVVLFGGRKLGDNLHYNETWEFDGAQWQLISTPTSPTPRRLHAMTYDAHRGVVVIFGGRNTSSTMMNDTWEYDGTTWVDRTNLNQQIPPPRRAAELVYNSNLHASFLHGGIGSSQLNDLWEWTGQQWIQRQPSGIAIPAAQHGMAYDSAANVIRRVLGEHIDLVGAYMAPSIIAQPQSVVAQVNDPATFSVDAVGDGTLSFQWRRNGLPIPGATQAAYIIAAVQANDGGAYDCEIRNADNGLVNCGITLSNPALLTVGSSCPEDIAPNGGDSVVDINDLFSLLGAWGACPK